MLRKKIMYALAITCIITSSSTMIANAQPNKSVNLIQESTTAYSPLDLDKIREEVNVKMATASRSAKESTIDSLNKITGVVRKYVTDYKELPSKIDVEKDKVWTVNFNKPVKESTMNSNTLKVVDIDGKEINVTLKHSGDLKTWRICPPSTGYKEGNTYAVIVRKGIVDNSQNNSKLKKEIIMKFIVKGSSDNDNTGEIEIPTNRDSMDVIIGTLKGKRSYDMSSGNDFKKLSAWRDNISGEQSREILDVKNYYDYENSIVTFLSKYKNSKYKDITDLDYYKKLPNLTINFDNVNNSNEYEIGSGHDSTLANYFGKSFRDFNDINYKAIIVAPTNMRNTDIWYSTISILRDYNTKHREAVFVWRTDVEKEMLDEINKRRKSKGMNPLKLDNDLIAMAKHSAKLSQLGFSHSRTYTRGLPLTDGATRLWARGSVPYPYKHTSVSDSYIEAVNFEDNVKKMFGYNKEVKAISEATAIYTNGKELLNAWEMKGNIYSYEWASLNKDTRRVEKVPSCISKERFDMPIKLDENIYNPNMKTIGIGCVHEPPISQMQLNGSLGVFIVTSK